MKTTMCACKPGGCVADLGVPLPAFCRGAGFCAPPKTLTQDELLTVAAEAMRNELPKGPPWSEGTKDTNPKDAAANGRVPLHMVPDTLALFAAMSFAEGDSKYIAYNFRVAGVRISVYVSALRRHLTRYYNGEWADAKTGVPHLASVAACCAILIDGHVTGIINDDRPPAVDLGDCIEEAERIIAHVYEMNKDKRPTGVEYTQLNRGKA